MVQRRSRAKAAGPSAAAPSSPPPASGVPSGTPAPSPTTSLGLGLASPDDVAGSLKSPASAPPRRSLRLAGVASPTTPTSAPPAQDGGSSGSGSGSGRNGNRRGRGRARASASPVASAMAGNSGSDDGRAGAKASADGGGSSGVGVFMSLRSRSRTAKRQADVGAQVGGETGAGSGGGVEDGRQVHDEMLQRDAGAPAKRFKRVMVEGVETEYVADSESGSDDDCVMLGEVCTKLQLSIGPSVVEEKSVPVNMNRIEEVTRDDPAGIGKEEFVDGASVPTYHFWTARSFEMEQFSPVGSTSSPEKEIYADMYFKEELRRSETRNGGKGEGKLVLGNNADASVGVQDGTSAQKYSPDTKGKGKMIVEDSLSSSSSSEDEMEFHPVHDSKGKGKIVVEDSLSSSSSSEDEMEFHPVDSKEIEMSSASVVASVEPIRRQAARERAIRLAPKFAFFKADKDEHSEDDDEEELEPAVDPQDWPGPFSTAARIYEEREARLRARESTSSKLKKSADKAILWSPSKDKKNLLRSAPSLTKLCLSTLADNAEGIESLGGIPDELKHKLLKMLCRSRKMNTHLLNELLCDSPTELQLYECSWLSEDDFEKTFGKCRTENLQSVCDKFVNELIPVHGSNMRELAFAGCLKLTSSSIKTIGQNCPHLSFLDLRNLNRLRDSAMRYLRNGCRQIKKLKLQRNSFSDEAVSRYLGESGGCLTELMLNSIEKAGDLTALAIAQKCSLRLEVLDLSFCRELTNEALGLIVDNCSSLRVLKLFGCTQVSDIFLKGHSNGLVTIVGMEGNILEQMDNR
ncbi:hypothetical protein PR202_ga21172 [Eleusine coracana subsp. coracana]|uniref:Uncharacterized protein n=1 Tax=Eleusine coracana subsp. coracana TaxID=191504 RepID=A0AAV5D0P8_ELECO|nr:hypothetical protein PR202_ga21172 [Eleusine coracana subsp. coracana]